MVNSFNLIIHTLHKRNVYTPQLTTRSQFYYNVRDTDKPSDKMG